MFKIVEIWCHPIKGLHGHRIDEIFLEQRGPRYDRRWMLVDASGKFISQRTRPDMVLISACVRGEMLEVTATDHAPLLIPVQEADGGKRAVKLFADRFDAPTVGAMADAWFSKVMGEPCHLVRVDDTVDRPLNSAYNLPDHKMSFADLVPVLMTTNTTLDHLNAHLDKPACQRNFRPNLVLDGGDPFAENSWRDVSIGDVRLTSGMHRNRCVVINVNPDTAAVDKQDAMSAVIKRLNPTFERPVFGQGFAVKEEGTVRVGDAVTLI